MATDQAFQGAGSTHGLQAWRIEDLQPVAVSRKDMNKLHMGDSYIFLNTSRGQGGKRWDIHFWLGKETSQDESGAAAYKSVELDDALGGGATQHRECQNHESDLFLSYFKESGLQYLEGGVASGFNQVDRDSYETRLFRVKGKRTVRVTQVPLSASSLTVDDVYILDKGLELFFFEGPDANRVEKAKGLDFIRKCKDEDRGGRADIVFMVDEPENASFWETLGGQQEVTKRGLPDDEHDRMQKKTTKVLRVHGTDDVETTDVTPSSGVLTKDLLDSKDVFILDVGSSVFVWIGKEAETEERKYSMTVATNYLAQNGKSTHTPVSRIVEEGEPAEFQVLFKQWNAPKPLDFTVQSQGIAQTQDDYEVDVNKLASSPVAKEEDLGLDGEHDIQVWRIEDMDKVPVPEELVGQFFGGDSYIVLDKKTTSAGRTQHIIYFWQGRDSTVDEKGSSAAFTTQLDDEMGGDAVQVRVVQGKEPAHFRALFDGKMIVHAGGKASGFVNRDDQDSYDEDGVKLYHVKGTKPENTVASQVEDSASALNSGDCFVLVTSETVFAWKGNGSNASEQEVALNVAKILQRNRDLEEVEEGDEPVEFWVMLGGKKEYAKQKAAVELPHAARLFHCSNMYGYFDAHEVMNFDQSDLSVDDVFLLDTYTTLFVWIGSKANEEEKKNVMKLADEYLDTVRSDGRDQGTPVVTVRCRREPPMFTSNFLAWDDSYFDKDEFVDPYETKLRKMREEKEKNAPEDLEGTITSEDVKEASAVSEPASSLDVSAGSFESNNAELVRMEEDSLPGSAPMPVPGQGMQVDEPGAPAPTSVSSAPTDKDVSVNELIREEEDALSNGAPVSAASAAEEAPVSTSSAVEDAPVSAASAAQEAPVSAASAASEPPSNEETSESPEPLQDVSESTAEEPFKPSAAPKEEEPSSEKEEISTPKEEAPVEKEESAPAKSSGGSYSYEQLVEGVDGIDITAKETYLSDADFAEVFGMDRAEFEKMPKWRQQRKKQDVNLF